MSDDDEMNVEDRGVKVRVQLNSLVPEYSVPKDAIAVPSEVRKSGLSKVVNYLLGNVEGGGDSSDSDDDSVEGNKASDKSVDFDFLIKNRFLRTSVSSYMRANNISAESVLQIDFVPKATKPENQGESEALPDWVSGLYFDAGTLFSACYDGTVRGMGGDKLEITSSLAAHGAPIRCIDGNGQGLLATGGHDQQLLVHEYPANKQSLATAYVCAEGHSTSVESVAWCKGESRLASGDFSGRLCLWDVSAAAQTSAQNPSSSKRQKTSSKTSKGSSPETLQAALSTPLHNSSISGLVWSSDKSAVITGSHDYSVRAFDVEAQGPALTLNSNRVVTCLAKSFFSDVVATGHPDTQIKLWDMRMKKNGGSDDSVITADTTLRPSHKSWISCISFDPNQVYNLTSASHDGTVKTWDVRCSLPLHTIKGHVGKIGDDGERGKALALAYGKDGGIYSGGSDGEVKRFG
ncbi:hypothetical protein TrRE_jg5633 [Triparma retinervis]|uniref:NLE domain-containing protein n=1 Tax=Triparma retinervis TaxID=2557542 RepID=A0A9W7AN51_9STRA|nr:hypothetical protein TrRE_jg5633 [Triparma retinervis]